ncbi:MAG: hypothetical protein HUU29_10430, partial [Planctomycetaceae bacterium]|nr:hypothetical protein [Planctomycetaceae bacterium]
FAELRALPDEKARLLDRVVATNGVIVFEHDPKVAAVRIKKGERYHEIVEHVTL